MDLSTTAQPSRCSKKNGTSNMWPVHRDILSPMNSASTWLVWLRRSSSRPRLLELTSRSPWCATDGRRKQAIYHHQLSPCLIERLLQTYLQEVWRKTTMSEMPWCTSLKKLKDDATCKLAENYPPCCQAWRCWYKEKTRRGFLQLLKRKHQNQEATWWKHQMVQRSDAIADS